MAGTVVSNLTDISLCEAVESWTGSPTPTVQDPLLYTAKEGTYCLQSYIASAVPRSARWDFGSLEANWKNFAGKFLYSWFAFSMKAYTTGTGTITIRFTDGAGKNREWDIFNKTTLPHIGWINWCIHADYGYDRQDSGFDVTKIRYVGWFLTDNAKGKVYIYWDAWRFGTGLSIKAGTDVSPAVWEDFYTAEGTYAYGVVDKIGGVYFVKGQIAIGSMTINESTYFKDSNQVVIFQDIKGTPSGVYELKGQRYDGGTGTTKIFFGENGIGGSVIKASPEMKFKLTMTDLGVTEFGFHGCIFQNADTITLPPYNANKKILNCNFISCAELLADTCKITSSNFISAPGRGIRMPNINSPYITDCNFIGCVYGIHCNFSNESPGVDFANLVFSGGDGVSKWDLEHSVAGTLRVNCSGTTNLQYVRETGGGNTNIVSTKVLTLSNIPQGTEVTIVRVSDGYVLFHEESVGESEKSIYSYGAAEQGTEVDILFMHLDYDPNIGNILNYILPTINTEIPVSLINDPVYYNPS